ncbi:hypothetical protein T01_285 [Trichinella spiralis]|uniref:Uncharacterized protein n=1 Tax=Trichinella spiralis TaxID=6334 RepID=A0A0V1BBV7_TRISP|nr:hypothetical protein T01_285 [Trichinella spiralis]
MRFKHVMSCIKCDTLGLKGVPVCITKCAYAYCSYVRRHAIIGRQIIRHMAYLEHSLHLLCGSVIFGHWLVSSFATSLETSVGRLPNRLDVLCACACSRHLFSVPPIQVPCICHGSADDPKENATGPFSTFVFDAILFREQQAATKSVWSNGPTG